MIRTFKNFNPDIHKTAYIDEQSTVIGNVKIGKDSAMWPQSVARGDINPIVIGERTNIQDGTLIHVTHKSKYSPGFSVDIGNDVTVGHLAIIHACKISDRVLIGMGSTVLDGAEIASDTMVGAGTLVGPGKHLESGYLYLGSPAKKIRELTEKERAFLIYSAKCYVDLKNEYLK
tara:strand:+ start:26 stop:547 length:522 start_codon:yes stop_codon:yes gene_type:complete